MMHSIQHTTNPSVIGHNSMETLFHVWTYSYYRKMCGLYNFQLHTHIFWPFIYYTSQFDFLHNSIFTISVCAHYAIHTNVLYVTMCNLIIGSFIHTWLGNFFFFFLFKSHTGFSSDFFFVKATKIDIHIQLNWSCVAFFFFILGKWHFIQQLLYDITLCFYILHCTLTLWKFIDFRTIFCF